MVSSNFTVVDNITSLWLILYVKPPSLSLNHNPQASTHYDQRDHIFPLGFIKFACIIFLTPQSVKIVPLTLSSSSQAPGLTFPFSKEMKNSSTQSQCFLPLFLFPNLQSVALLSPTLDQVDWMWLLSQESLSWEKCFRVLSLFSMLSY